MNRSSVGSGDGKRKSSSRRKIHPDFSQIRSSSTYREFQTSKLPSIGALLDILSPDREDDDFRGRKTFFFRRKEGGSVGIKCSPGTYRGTPPQSLDDNDESLRSQWFEMIFCPPNREDDDFRGRKNSFFRRKDGSSGGIKCFAGPYRGTQPQSLDDNDKCLQSQCFEMIFFSHPAVRTTISWVAKLLSSVGRRLAPAV